MVEQADLTPATGDWADAAYRSEPLAALLHVFSLWGSGGFIGALSRQVGTDLDTTSVVAVTLLAQRGALRPSVLATQLRVGASNVSKISGQLIDRGLVERVPDPVDARASLLRLTDAGRELMRALVAAGDEMMAQILGDWSAPDRSDFARLLKRFETNALSYADTILPR